MPINDFFRSAARRGIAAAAIGQERDPRFRPEVGKPIQAALELLKSKRGKEALAKAREAQAVRDKSAYENYLVERVIGQAAAAAGEAGTAARHLEAAAASGAAPGGERQQILAAAAGRLRDQGVRQGKRMAGRYLRDGGSDKAVRTIYVQSLYLSNNFAAAAKAIVADIEHEERAGRAPSEERCSCWEYLFAAEGHGRLRQGDGEARRTLPEREYWQSVLHGSGPPWLLGSLGHRNRAPQDRDRHDADGRRVCEAAHCR